MCDVIRAAQLPDGAACVSFVDARRQPIHGRNMLGDLNKEYLALSFVKSDMLASRNSHFVTRQPRKNTRRRELRAPWTKDTHLCLGNFSFLSHNFEQHPPSITIARVPLRETLQYFDIGYTSHLVRYSSADRLGLFFV